jgi:hypothetical protein
MENNEYLHTSASVVESDSFFPMSLFRHSSCLVSDELEVESALACEVRPGTIRGILAVIL